MISCLKRKIGACNSTCEEKVFYTEHSEALDAAIHCEIAYTVSLLLAVRLSTRGSSRPFGLRVAFSRVSSSLYIIASGAFHKDNPSHNKNISVPHQETVVYHHRLAIENTIDFDL